MPTPADEIPLPPLLAPDPALLSPAAAQTSRRRAGWENALLALEIVIAVAALATLGIFARKWAILRPQLPTDGLTIVTAPPDGPAPGPAQRASSPAEIPSHLRGWLEPESQTSNVAVPQPQAQPGTRIRIPSIGLDAPIGEGTDRESLKYKVGHHPGTANPGQRGNMVLAAHNDVYGELFRYLPDVPLGEIVTVYAGEQQFRYRITGRRIIVPTQTEVMLPTTEPTLTLISCYPYLIDTHRIVLFGELVD